MARRSNPPARPSSRPPPPARRSSRPPRPPRPPRPGASAELAPSTPAECLLLAVRAKDADERARYAEMGLGLRPLADEETIALLRRQLYVAFLEREDQPRAEAMARELVRSGVLRDLAHHDLARLLAARRDFEGAIGEQRLAARNAPPERRSFHLWALATLQHFAGDVGGALATLDRALRVSVRDRPLLKAHAAFIRLDSGMPVPRLDAVRRELSASPNREGYGQYLLGMIANAIGDTHSTIVHLGAFVRRNESIDRAKELTLKEELRRARIALAALAHD